MMRFIDFCDKHKILLAIFPPQSTHSLQPLDVVIFSPLAHFYSDFVTEHLHNSQTLVGGNGYMATQPSRCTQPLG